MSDTGRIMQIQEEIPCLTIHDATLIAIENQLNRIADAMSTHVLEGGVSVLGQLDSTEETAVKELQKAFAELQEKDVRIGT